MASSVFVRHTLNALYSDLRVELRKVLVNTPPPHPSPAGLLTPQGTADSGQGDSKKLLVRRQKSVFIGLCVQGIARVSGGSGQWEV
jgi:hypothetical protein